MKTETRRHPTPAGGTYSRITYMDDEKNPVEKDKATGGTIVECDDDGNILMTTYFRINRSGAFDEHRPAEV